MPLNDVPLASQSLGQTQAPIRANFATIAAAFPVDHVDYGLGDQGKHNKVTFPQQAVLPATGANEVALYCANSDIHALTPALYFKDAGFGVGVPGYNFTDAVYTAAGRTKLPSGIVLCWGSDIINVGTTVTVTPPAAAFSTSILHVQITGSTNPVPNKFVSVTAIAAHTFNVSIDSAFGFPFGFFWLAIGY